MLWVFLRFMLCFIGRLLVFVLVFLPAWLLLPERVLTAYFPQSLACFLGEHERVKIKDSHSWKCCHCGTVGEEERGMY